MNDSFYCLWLSNVGGVGARNASLLLDTFGNAENIWNASTGEIIARGFASSVASCVTNPKDKDGAKALAEELEKRKIGFIGIEDKSYPPDLKNIYAPPIGLYIKGELPKDELLHISIVGTRKCSEYGARMAFSFAKKLASEGICVVSGMAEGIDSIAHRGALEGGGKTIAVLGCGVDICYPISNRNLMEEIISNGCVISEYPPGTRPMPSNFPARNRIISGLSKAVLAVEAGEKSGTLITVDHALEQGKDVFAVPGNATNPKSAGTNSLIQQGATLVVSPEALLEEMGFFEREEGSFTEEYADNKLAELDDDQKVVYDYVGGEPKSIGEISQKTGYAVHTLQYILTMLEMKGIVKRLHGNRYIRC